MQGFINLYNNFLFTSCNRFPVVVPEVIQLCPPADGDDDGHIADQHDKDGQDPGESYEVGKIQKFLVVVCDSNGVHAQVCRS